jgi:hypothetical protein
MRLLLLLLRLWLSVAVAAVNAAGLTAGACVTEVRITKPLDGEEVLPDVDVVAKLIVGPGHNDLAVNATQFCLAVNGTSVGCSTKSHLTLNNLAHGPHSVTVSWCDMQGVRAPGGCDHTIGLHVRRPPDQPHESSRAPAADAAPHGYARPAVCVGEVVVLKPLDGAGVPPDVDVRVRLAVSDAAAALVNDTKGPTQVCFRVDGKSVGCTSEPRLQVSTATAARAHVRTSHTSLPPRRDRPTSAHQRSTQCLLPAL